MVEHLGEATLPISALLVSDGFAERLTRPSVIKLSESIRELTLLQAPIVRASDSRVAAGEDRVAACCLLDYEEIVCRLVECSDAELEAIRKAENDCRRNATAEELLAMVEERAEEAPMYNPLTHYPDGSERIVKFISETGDVPLRPGRKKAKRTEAIEAVAADVGRSAEAVRKAAERAQRKRENATIETWGREQPAEWLEQVSSARATLTEASAKVQAAMAALTRVSDTGILRPEVGLRLYEDLKNEAHALRSARPACVCAWCKNLSKVVKACTACHGRGYLSEEAAESVPESLKATEAVMVGGKMEPPFVTVIAKDPAEQHMAAAVPGIVAAIGESLQAREARDLVNGSDAAVYAGDDGAAEEVSDDGPCRLFGNPRHRAAACARCAPYAEPETASAGDEW